MGPYRGFPSGSRTRWLDREHERRLRCRRLGAPNETLTLEEVRLESDQLRFHGVDKLAPRDLSLTTIIEDPAPGLPFEEGPIGTNGFKVQLETSFERVPDFFSPVTIHLVFDRGELHIPVSISPEWDVPTKAGFASLLGMAAPLLAAARWLPARWNRW